MTLKDRLKLMEVEDWPKSKRDFFHAMVKQGNSISMAHMLASQKTPLLNGNINSEFGKSMRSKMESMSPAHRKLIMDRAKRAGVKNIDGKYLLPGLRPENPEAWVTGVDEAAETFKRNKLNSAGVVNVTCDIDPTPPKQIRLAPDITNRIAQEKISQDPKLQEAITKNPKKLTELKEQVIEEHGAPRR